MFEFDHTTAHHTTPYQQSDNSKAVDYHDKNIVYDTQNISLVFNKRHIAPLCTHTTPHHTTLNSTL